MIFAELRNLDDGTAPDDLRTAAAGPDVPLRGDVSARDARRRSFFSSGGYCVAIVVKTHAEFNADNSAEGRVRTRPHGRRRPPRVEDTESMSPVPHAIINNEVFHHLSARSSAPVLNTLTHGSLPLPVARGPVLGPRVVSTPVRRDARSADVDGVVFGREF